MNYDAHDIDVLAKTLYGEARGEPDSGKAAVAWVIRNRAERSEFVRPRSLTGQIGAVTAVCLAPWQFSCWNASDPNRAILDALTPEKYGKELDVANQVLTGLVPDPTNGADHYHTTAKPVWAEAWPPYWVKAMAETARFGGHVFYNSRLVPKVKVGPVSHYAMRRYFESVKRWPRSHA